jgi:hypothetical protein
MPSLTKSYSVAKGRVKQSPTFRNRIYRFMATFHFNGVEAGVSHYCHRIVHKLTGNDAYKPNISDERFSADNVDSGPDELVIQSPNVKWGSPYEPWRKDLFDKAVQSLPIRLDDYSFVDFGAGKGLALLLAANYSFKSIVGVEYSKTLADTATANIQDYQKQRGSHPCIQCVWADAADFELPNGPTVLYLCNPFQGKVMDRVIANIEKSLQTYPRDLWVIYGTPWEVRKFRRSAMFKTIEWNSEYSLHRSICR